MTYIDRINALTRWAEMDLPTDKAVILGLNMLALFNSRGWPEWASVDTRTLMQMVRVDNKQTAFRTRDALVSAGFLEYRKGRKGKANEYRLVNTFGCKYVTKSVTKSVTESVTESVTKSVTESVTPNKTKIKTKNNPPTPLEGVTPELQAEFDDWLRYKAERREAYKPTGLQKLRTRVQNAAKTYGDEAVAALIRECMASNWAGIIFDRLEKPKRKEAEPDDYWTK